MGLISTSSCWMERSYRGPNGPNLQTTYGPDAYFLGPDQLSWLKRGLSNSRATWKVIASDMPLSLIVRDDYAGKRARKRSRKATGPPRGANSRLPICCVFIRDSGVANTVWLNGRRALRGGAFSTIPTRRSFRISRRSGEIVAGPLHAGNGLTERTRQYFRARGEIRQSRSARQDSVASDGMQFFGHVRIDGATGK